MEFRKCALAAATGLLLMASATATMSIPSALAEYGSWTELTPGPTLMPYGLAMLCMPATAEQSEQARKSHGPHADLWAAVYANPAALATLKTKSSTDFPAGAIIAKRNAGNARTPRLKAWPS